MQNNNIDNQMKNTSQNQNENRNRNENENVEINAEYETFERVVSWIESLCKHKQIIVIFSGKNGCGKSYTQKRLSETIKNINIQNFFASISGDSMMNCTFMDENFFEVPLDVSSSEERKTEKESNYINRLFKVSNVTKIIFSHKKSVFGRNVPFGEVEYSEWDVYFGTSYPNLKMNSVLSDDYTLKTRTIVYGKMQL